MHRNISSLFLQYARLERKRTLEGLNDLEEQLWTNLNRYLTQRLSLNLPRGTDRRTSIRVATDLPCTFGVLPRSSHASIEDLSRSGVFLRTDRPLPVGTEIWLRIPIESGAIEASGVVATNRQGPRCGMGVRFAPIAPDAMKAIDDLYQRSIVRRFGEPQGEVGVHEDERDWEDVR